MPGHSELTRRRIQASVQATLARKQEEIARAVIAKKSERDAKEAQAEALGNQIGRIPQERIRG